LSAQHYEDSRITAVYRMALRLILVTLAAVAFVTSSIDAKALASDAKAQIEERERHCAAAGVSSTIDEATECYSSSPEVVAYDIFIPREFDGPEAIRGYFQNFFASGFKNAKVEFVSLVVTTDGTLGYTHSIQHLTAVTKNGTQFDAFARVSDVWRKENGRWKIILSHGSFPVDPITFKADTQSKP
jgi:ketosteroid isomerase-like protein